ncbi:MAG: hypothetical protein KAJ66_01335 [Candidatus Omnitrophica bacterium]|nr:hypothetical protein [Candidatus Omnitrophota bacterium]
MPYNKILRYKTAIIITFLCLFTLLGVDTAVAVVGEIDYDSLSPAHWKGVVLTSYYRVAGVQKRTEGEGVSDWWPNIGGEFECQYTLFPVVSGMTRSKRKYVDNNWIERWTTWSPWTSTNYTVSPYSGCYGTSTLYTFTNPYSQYSKLISSNGIITKKVGVRIDPALFTGSMPGIFRIYGDTFYSDDPDHYLLNGKAPIPGKPIGVDADDEGCLDVDDRLNNGLKRYKMCLYYNLGRIYSGKEFEVDITIPDFFTQELTYYNPHYLYQQENKYRGFRTGDIQLTIDVKGAHPVKTTAFYPSLAKIAGVLKELKEDDYKTIKIQYDIRGFEDTLEIYSLIGKTNYGGQGKIIRTISAADLKPTAISEGSFWDTHQWEWDGKDDDGNIVPKGIYPIGIHFKGEKRRGIVNGEVMYDPNQGAFAYLVYGKPVISGKIATFKAVGHRNIYLNLYDDKFRLIKKLLTGEEVSFRSEPVEWDFTAYAPGTYHYTVYAGDDNDTQSHVRGGHFELPTDHIPVGKPKDDPPSGKDIFVGWENEGAIVRVRAPGVIYYEVPEERFKDKAEKVKAIFDPNPKDKNASEPTDPEYEMVMLEGAYRIHLLSLLEHCDIFYYSGHAFKDSFNIITADEIRNVNRTHLGKTYPFTQVFIDGCNSAAGELASAFDTKSYMGWLDYSYSIKGVSISYSTEEKDPDEEEGPDEEEDLDLEGRNFLERTYNCFSDGYSMTAARCLGLGEIDLLDTFNCTDEHTKKKITYNTRDYCKKISYLSGDANWQYYTQPFYLFDGDILPREMPILITVKTLFNIYYEHSNQQLPPKDGAIVNINGVDYSLDPYSCGTKTDKDGGIFISDNGILYSVDKDIFESISKEVYKTYFEFNDGINEPLRMPSKGYYNAPKFY